MNKKKLEFSTKNSKELTAREIYEKMDSSERNYSIDTKQMDQDFESESFSSSSSSIDSQ